MAPSSNHPSWLSLNSIIDSVAPGCSASDIDGLLGLSTVGIRRFDVSTELSAPRLWEVVDRPRGRHALLVTDKSWSDVGPIFCSTELLDDLLEHYSELYGDSLTECDALIIDLEFRHIIVVHHSGYIGDIRSHDSPT